MKQHELAMNIKKWQVTKTVICTVALYYGFKKVFYFKIISVSHEHFLLRFSPMLAFSTLDFSVSLSKFTRCCCFSMCERTLQAWCPYLPLTEMQHKYPNQEVITDTVSFTDLKKNFTSCTVNVLYAKMMFFSWFRIQSRITFCVKLS